MSDSLIIKREITLFPHQNRLNDGVVKSWETKQNVIAVLPTGGGKSFCVADLAKKFLMRGEHCIVFAHRDVLISQLSDSLCEMDIPHTFIASKSAILDITNDQVKKFGRSFYDESSPVILSSVPTFQQRLKKGLLNQLAPLIKCWIQDECFIAGTLIDGRPIESLVEGDLVTSFNEHTNQYELKPVVRLFKNKSPDKLLKICTRSHHVLTCTYGHPFWTKRGWVNAIDLTTDDEVLIHIDSSMCEQKERSVSHWSRLESISIQESRNIGNTHDGFVYNIEVEGNHTYVANGVTVHNCHHHLTENIWGKCTEPLINAKGVGFTATPCRSDNKGLGRDAHGVFDDIIVGSTMSELIEIGRLSPYRIYTVPTKLDVSTVNITSSGDYNQKKLALVTDNADITGDAVEHYKRLANGKQAITFCVNIEHAEHVAQQFNDAGISSAALSSKTPLRERQHKLDQFRKGKILNLVNVNLFGEGFSVDAVCVVIMLRKTMSYGLFYQMFGRALRVMEGKEYGILLDHVGNVREHCIYGAPHDCPEWSLEPPKKKKKKSTDLKGIKSRTCPKCFGFYEPKSNSPKSFVCPYCHHSESEDEIIAAVKEIQVAEGTLTEYDCEYITGLIQRRQEVDMPVEKIKAKHRFSPDVVRHSAAKNHLKRQEAQRKLRAGIAQWCKQTAETNLLDVQTTQAEFERVFGTDVFKAQTLGEREALLLLDKIHG